MLPRLLLAPFCALGLALAQTQEAPLSHPVTFAPGEAKSPLAPRFSPPGTKVQLLPAKLQSLEGIEHLTGRVPLGAKEVRGEGQLIAIARSAAAKPYDLLFVDKDGDGQLSDETAISTEPKLSREKWWSSFDGTLRALHGEEASQTPVDYPCSLWVVVETEGETPTVIRYSRRGYSVGTVVVGAARHTVLISDGNNDGVIGEGDYWTLSREGESESSAGKDWRKMPDFCWAGKKAFRLEMEGTAGASGRLLPFDPGVTEEEDAIKRDRYKTDREAVRAAEPLKFDSDYEAALKRAQDEKKPLFIKFETDWCGPCATMTRLVFTAKDVVEAAEQVVCVKVDGDKRKDLVAAHKVSGYPTIVVLDASGQEVNRLVGYKGVKEITAAFLKLKP